MILDNLSIAGLFIASLFLLLPLLFGKEFLRVDETRPETIPATDDTWNSAPEAAACAEG